MTNTVAVIGGGVIGGGWAARFALMGWSVRVYDPDPEAAGRLSGVMNNARLALPGLSDVALPDEGAVVLCASVAEAVAGADWIQESVPERLKIKHRVLAEIQGACPGGAIIGSSTSGFKPSQLQQGALRPGQIMVAHPFNPVYLLPLCELVTTEASSADQVARACDTLSGIGMFPLHLRGQIDAHIADRLLEAVWREALWMFRDSIATTGEIDEAIRMGFGLCWAQMGLFETCRIAGRAAGMRHFTEQSGPCLQRPWTGLTDVPDLSEALIDAVAGQSDAQSGMHTIDALERIRDTNLVAMMRGLKAQNWGAGAVLRAQDARIAGDGGFHPPYAAAIVTGDRAVPLDWVDYNGHMNEARYLQAFGDATDRFMEMIGCDAAHIAAGGSYFTAETHIRHIDEAKAGARIRVETLCLLGKGAKMHLFHQMFCGERLLATGELFLLHVSLDTRRPCAPSAAIADALGTIARAHGGLPRPGGVGRAAGRK